MPRSLSNERALVAQAVEALWPAEAPLRGLVVTRYGHIPARPPGVPQRSAFMKDKIKLYTEGAQRLNPGAKK